jgi:hypothetical protein
MTSQSAPRYADVVPYDVPARLADLTGPTTGIVRVGGHIDTSPTPFYDLADSNQVWALYSRVVRDGTRQDQERLLNRALLVELWPTLQLPARCRLVWVSRFSELAAAA